MNKYNKEIPCAYCGRGQPLRDYPNPTYAKCEECIIREQLESFTVQELLLICFGLLLLFVLFAGLPFIV